MTFKDINARFTEIVAEYISKGWRINAGTMSGSQGEIAHIDLTDGASIIRVVAESFTDYKNQTEGVEIKVGRSTDKVKADGQRDLATIWNNRLEIICAEKFYQIGRERRDGSKFYGSKEEAEKAMAVRFERYEKHRAQETKEFPEAAKKVVLSFVKRQPKHKGVKIGEIESVYRVTRKSLFNDSTSNAYYVKVRGNVFRLK